MENVIREVLNTKFKNEKLTEYALSLLTDTKECIDSSFEYYRIKYNKYTNKLRVKKLNCGFKSYDEVIIHLNNKEFIVEDISIEMKYKSISMHRVCI